MKALLAALAIVFALPAQACQLALVLAIDISNSVDSREFAIQTEGLADALLDPVVSEGLLRAEAAVTVILWSGPNNLYVVVPWRRMDTPQTIRRTADDARAIRRVYGQSNTALGAMVAFARGLFDDVPHCLRRTIDVSGDGRDNAGTDPARERDEAEALRITINGLAIDRDTLAITRFFRDNVITRNGFVMTSQGHEGYAETLKRKMRREVSEALM